MPFNEQGRVFIQANEIRDFDKMAFPYVKEQALLPWLALAAFV